MFYLDLQQDCLTVPGCGRSNRRTKRSVGKTWFFFADDQGTLEGLAFSAEAETGEPIIIKARRGELNEENWSVPVRFLPVVT